jgi:hypothetical protein
MKTVLAAIVIGGTKNININKSLAGGIYTGFGRTSISW